MPMEVAHASILPEPFPRLPQPLDETASLAHKKMRSSRASPEDAIIWLKPTMYERGVTEKRLVFVFFFFTFSCASFRFSLVRNVEEQSGCAALGFARDATTSVYTYSVRRYRQFMALLARRATYGPMKRLQSEH